MSLSGRSVCRPTRLAGSCHLLLYVCVFTGVTGDFPFSMLVGAARLGWSSDATPGFRFVQLHPVLIVGRRRPKHWQLPARVGSCCLTGRRWWGGASELYSRLPIRSIALCEVYTHCPIIGNLLHAASLIPNYFIIHVIRRLPIQP